MPDWLTREQRSRNMSAIRSSGTTPEQQLAALLKKEFPRRKIVAAPGLPGKPDFFLPGLKLAVFADGCFWHYCPRHGRIPSDNREYWEAKLLRNRKRDRKVTTALRLQGIHSLRIWEHELEGTMGTAKSKITRWKRENF